VPIKEPAIFFPEFCAQRRYLYTLPQPQAIPDKFFSANSNPIQVENPRTNARKPTQTRVGRGKKEKLMGPIKGELPENFSGPLPSRSCFSLLINLYICFIIKTFSVLLLLIL
jgi:hypothetical protein